MPSAETISGFCEAARINKPKPGAVEELPDRHCDDDPGGDKKQPICRKRLAGQEDNTCKGLWRFDLQGLWPPGEAHDFTQHQRQAERHHQEGAGFAPVEAPQDDKLEQHSDDAHRQRRQQQSRPETTRRARDRIADECAEHIEGAVRKIDDAHDPEDQGQADAEEEQQRCLRQRV